MTKRDGDRLYDAMIAAGMDEVQARTVADNIGKLRDNGDVDNDEQDIRIVILDANTCLVHGRRVVSVQAAIQIMRMLRESQEKPHE